MAEGRHILKLSNGLEEKEFSIQIKNNSRSRSIILRIGANDILSVTKPRYVPIKEALKFVESRGAWVFDQIKNRVKRESLLEYVLKGAEVFVMGNALKVLVMNSSVKEFFVEDFDEGKVVFACKEGDEKSFEKIFLEYASERLSALIKKIADGNMLSYKSISVRNQRSRWASCSSSGTLSFNWRMIFLPSNLQEYIIFHEFAHTQFMDHSVSFWIHLSRMCPNAKKLDRMLAKEAQHIFNIARD